jgi:beta-ketodecanoyl-[acyl-carrier-protein] synthase
VRRFWLHQANLGMNQLVAQAARPRGRRRHCAHHPGEYANTASAGSIIAFHLHRADLAPATWA